LPLLVDENSRLPKALDLHPDVLDYIVSLNPHDFKRLHNPLMRRLMPPRITLKRIAAMVKKPIQELLAEIHDAAGSPLSGEEKREIEGRAADATVPAGPGETPAWTLEEPTEVIDLLESDEQLDSDPMMAITQALRRHEPGEVVVIRHKWEPQPLYDVWAKAGVEHHAEQAGPDEWRIFIRKNP